MKYDANKASDIAPFTVNSRFLEQLTFLTYLRRTRPDTNFVAPTRDAKVRLLFPEEGGIKGNAKNNERVESEK